MEYEENLICSVVSNDYRTKDFANALLMAIHHKKGSCTMKQFMELIIEMKFQKKTHGIIIASDFKLFDTQIDSEFEFHILDFNGNPAMKIRVITTEELSRYDNGYTYHELPSELEVVVGGIIISYAELILAMLLKKIPTIDGNPKPGYYEIELLEHEYKINVGNLTD